MTLLARTCALLDARGVAHALIGAAALAAHGVTRATADLDLPVVDPRCLDAPFWTSLAAALAAVDIRPPTHPIPWPESSASRPGRKHQWT